MTHSLVRGACLACRQLAQQFGDARLFGKQITPAMADTSGTALTQTRISPRFSTTLVRVAADQDFLTAFCCQ